MGADTQPPEFAGDRKSGQSFLGPAERRFIDRWVTRIPAPIEGWHLTMLTLVWSFGTVFFAYLSLENRWWIWAMSALVFLQWLTDSFDGSLGKHRKAGLIKWGFFMDHLLDLIFAGSIVIGYYFLAPEGTAFMFLVLMLVTCASMAVSFLSFAATNQFQIAHYGIGPTEIRIGWIALNTFVFFAGEGVFWWGLPLVIVLNIAALVLLAYQTQKTLWELDKANNVDVN